MERAIQTKPLLCKTWKTKTVAALLAVIAAVALPQVFHLLGMVSDLGTALGETFLPMHLAIFLVGYFAGPVAGLAAGLVSPAVSFGLTTAMGQPMPGLVMLPYMMIELGVYGLVTGLFARVEFPVVCSLLIAQVAGRAVRALTIVIGVYAFGSALPVATIWTSILAGLPGLILQWVLVPLIVFWVEKKAKKDE